MHRHREKSQFVRLVEGRSEVKNSTTGSIFIFSIFFFIINMYIKRALSTGLARPGIAGRVKTVFFCCCFLRCDLFWTYVVSRIGGASIQWNAGRRSETACGIRVCGWHRATGGASRSPSNYKDNLSPRSPAATAATPS